MLCTTDNVKQKGYWGEKKMISCRRAVEWRWLLLVLFSDHKKRCVCLWTKTPRLLKCLHIRVDEAKVLLSRSKNMMRTHPWRAAALSRHH